MKRALVTGVTGQDGSYLADLLLGKGYEVYGIVRRHAVPSRGNLTPEAFERVSLMEADLCDQSSLDDVVRVTRPDEVYSLGAQSFVGASYTQPWYTLDVTGLGPLRLFEAVRKFCPGARVYQASSSEVFGQAMTKFKLQSLNEESPVLPVSPYGVAKLTAHMGARYYRTAYGMFVTSGILFNHESTRRGEQFITRKISKAMARFAVGDLSPLKLGNLDAQRDWGFAPEYVEGMWRMLQQDEPGEFVLATGEGHSVREFLEEAWRVAGIDGSVEEAMENGVVSVQESELRPSDIPVLIGDASRAKRELGWEAKVKMRGLAKIMVEHDIEEAKPA